LLRAEAGRYRIPVAMASGAVFPWRAGPRPEKLGGVNLPTTGTYTLLGLLVLSQAVVIPANDCAQTGVEKLPAGVWIIHRAFRMLL